MIWDDELIFINTGIKVSKQLISNQDVVTITWVPPWRGTCLEHVWNMKLWRWGFCSSKENVGWETCRMPWAFNRPLGAYFWKWVPITNSTMFFGSSYWTIVNNAILHVFLGSLWYHFACVSPPSALPTISTGTCQLTDDFMIFARLEVTCRLAGGWMSFTPGKMYTISLPWEIPSL